MSDIKQLLEQAVDLISPFPSEETVEADVLRGRAALARSRRRRVLRSSMMGAAAATVLVGALIAVGNTEREQPDTSRQLQPAGVQLVAYGGKQVDGFIVNRVPEGWYLQGSSAFALTIAPEGTTNTHPSNFVGKLVVFLLSRDAKQELPEGEPVEVSGNKGVVTNTGSDVTTLSYEDGDGHFVQIQYPEVLGWTNDQLVSFAEGVQVTAEAKQGRG